MFTTHTPVSAGHDRFEYDLVKRALGEIIPFDVLRMLGGQDRLNMTLLALNLSRYVNGVARRHEEVSRLPWHQQPTRLAGVALALVVLLNILFW